MAKNKTVKKVVAWFIPKKSLIKFDGEEDSIQVADNVMQVSDFDKYPVMKNDTVNVIIENDEVVFLRKVKGTTKKESTQTESKSSDEVDETITKEVFCVSQYGLKFVGDKKWTNFSDNLQKKDLKSMGVIAKNTITASLANGKIVDVKVEAKKVEKAKESTFKKSSYRDEEATDKRTASMNAKDVVVALLNNKELEKAKLKNAIEDLTKTFYEITKNL